MKNGRFSALVSLMLSSQTKDEVTDAAVLKLREAVGGSLNVDAILAASGETISEPSGKLAFGDGKHSQSILPRNYMQAVRRIVRFRYIKQTARKLQDDFNSDVPKTVDELCSLPGVGPKMAFLALQTAWNLFVWNLFQRLWIM